MNNTPQKRWCQSDPSLHRWRNSLQIHHRANIQVLLTTFGGAYDMKGLAIVDLAFENLVESSCRTSMNKNTKSTAGCTVQSTKNCIQYRRAKVVSFWLFVHLHCVYYYINNHNITPHADSICPESFVGRSLTTVAETEFLTMMLIGEYCTCMSEKLILSWTSSSAAHPFADWKIISCYPLKFTFIYLVNVATVNLKVIVGAVVIICSSAFQSRLFNFAAQSSRGVVSCMNLCILWSFSLTRLATKKMLSLLHATYIL